MFPLTPTSIKYKISSNRNHFAEHPWNKFLCWSQKYTINWDFYMILAHFQFCPKISIAPSCIHTIQQDFENYSCFLKMVDFGPFNVICAQSQPMGHVICLCMAENNYTATVSTEILVVTWGLLSYYPLCSILNV